MQRYCSPSHVGRGRWLNPSNLRLKFSPEFDTLDMDSVHRGQS